MEMYDNLGHVEDTFNEENLSECLKAAQRAEFAELEKILQSFEKPVDILDIGIGDARIVRLIVARPALWEKVGSYHGVDVAQNCIDISEKTIAELGVGDKVSAQLLDAMNLDCLKRKFDLIISTWFTVGNFYPTNFDFASFKPGYDMTTNDKFTTIFRKAYALLKPGGEIVIGSMYIDNDDTRKKQEESYRNFGWTVITDERDCFTATKDGWWSQRFTKQRLYDYLDFIPRERISFTPLDAYDYAMMVRIKK